MLEHIEPPGLGPPTDPFTHVVVAGDTVYLAGQIPVNEANEMVGIGDPRVQAEQTWTNIRLALESVGCGLADVAKITVFVKDIRDSRAEVAVRQEAFGDLPMPACTLVQVANLGFPEMLMEIEAIAVRP